MKTHYMLRTGHDNRGWIGPLFVLLLSIQVVFQILRLYDLGKNILAGSGNQHHPPATAMGISAVVQVFASAAATAAAISQLMQYKQSKSQHGAASHFGLFHPALLAFVAASLGAQLVDMYFAFFTEAQWKTPMWGPNATRENTMLLLKFADNAIAAFLLLVVRNLPTLGSVISLPEDDARENEGLQPLDMTDAQAKLRDLSKELPARRPSDEMGNSIISNIMFIWVNRFLAIGNQRQPEFDDLLEPPPCYMPENSWARFAAHANTNKPLFWKLVATFKFDIIFQAILNPAFVFLEYAQPFFMQQVLWFINKYSQDPTIGLRYGYFVAFMMLLTSIIAPIVDQQQCWHSRTISMQLRNILFRKLTQKVLYRRAASTLNVQDLKDDQHRDMSDGRVYNIVTADVARLNKLITLFYLLFTVPFQQIVGAWCLYKLLGLAGLLGTALLLVIVRLLRNLVARAKKVEQDISLLNDQRLATISEVVQGISSVKLFGWGSRFIEIIGRKRADQLSMIWTRAKIWALVNLLTVGSMPIINFIVFFIFGSYSGLGAEAIFPAIALFKIVQRSVYWLPSLMADVTGMYVSFCRIEDFLDQPEIQSVEARADTESNGDTLGFSNAVLTWSRSMNNCCSPMQSTPPSSSSSSLNLMLMSFTLQNINIRFPLGKLTLIGGPTGSGKSSILAALTGEMELIQGKINVPILEMPANALFSSLPGYALDNIAYVSQEPWLRNASIRDNILFGEPYCQVRYEKVLNMCALRPDLSIFAGGDMTEIGERGITLSGGQKQRVALARAVYSRRSILLIDDCLSAVDAHTGRHILHKCLASRDEIISNRTRILVTHHMAMCLPHSDFIVMMEGGEVAFQGLPEALSNTKDKLDLGDAGSDYGSVDASSIDSNVNDFGNAGQPTQDELNKQRLLSLKSDTQDHGKIIEEETRVKGVVKLETWRAYFGPCGGWRFLVSALVSVAASQLLSMYKDYYLAARLDKGSNSLLKPPLSIENSPQRRFLGLLAVYLAIGLVSAIFGSLALLYFYTKSIASSTVLHERLVLSIVNATPRFLDTTPIGRIMSRFSKDMQIVDEDIMECFFTFLRSLLSMLITLVAISSGVPLFLIVGIPVMIVYADLTWKFMCAQRETKRLEGIGMAPILSLYSEIIPGCSSIRAFNMRCEYIDEMKKRLCTYLHAELIMKSMSRWIGMRMGIASSLVSFSTALFIILSAGKIESGLAGFILIYSVNYWTDSIAVVRQYSDLELALNCVERMHQYMTIEQEAAPRTEADKQTSTEWPCTGALSVSNLSAGYTATQPVLHDISFDICHGEKIGIVGRTGAGKSTLSRTLLRLTEPSSGIIELDGVNVSTLGLEKLRQNITIIPQDPVLYNGTIRFNLDPFGDYSDPILLDALQRTMLLKKENTPTTLSSTQLDQINSSNYQPSSVAVFSSLDDRIVSNGQNLSLGQRQLVALARALVRRSRLVVMDEATASVDFATDKSMQQTIRSSEFSNSTILCIAHRLRTIIDYDRILVLDRGKVIEFDSPENMLQKEDSLFYQLCKNSGELDVLKRILDKKN
ncbi:hypothetical protein GGI25_004222 [Coemansia spiralis]|uniref:P-loop containing nucleoside triphosphate hydrolase protein n=1 Tax=Coemansia spiralis TaxID=417178 RepID=A0A9W8G5Z3_9FUNG|nr:hypothetical protein GGI25_004222 [Coemansia spiralis]